MTKHNLNPSDDKTGTAKTDANAPANDVDPSSPGNTGPMYSELHAAALGYIAKGWPVFPITPGEKIPLLGSQGFKDATTDRRQIDAWWFDNPGANIGFWPEGAGIAVFDQDPEGQWEGHANVKTPRGRHYYYAGSIPQSASKVAPHVDTRGQTGYVLLPPSITENGRYEWLDEPTGSWDLPDIPRWAADKCTAPKAEPRTAAVELTPDKVDQPQAKKLFKQYLEKHPIPPEGEGSDDATYRAVARARDLGLSDDTIAEMILAATDFDEPWIEEKIANAGEYKQNQDGCEAPPAPSDYAKFASNVVSLRPTMETAPAALLADLDGWAAHDPRDPADMPELAFFDGDKMIPKSPDGAVGILYGKRGDHKTNTLLSMLDRSGAQRILYAAGEGAYGVERDRLSARPGLNGRVKVLARVPLFSSPEQVEKFIAANDGFRPEIVVLDTLATVLAGEDEQSSTTASYLTDNGPAGIIKRAWNCTVILIAHAGKDVSKGVRGSSGFEGNVDFVLLVSADKSNCAIRLKCEKMRDGYDGHESYWQYEAAGVPVPMKISGTEYQKLTKPAVVDEAAPVGMQVKVVLRRLNAVSYETGISTADLAAAITEYEVGPRPGELGDDGVAEWDTCKAKWQRTLTKRKTDTAWGRKCHDDRIQKGGAEMITLWFCPGDDSEL